MITGSRLGAASAGDPAPTSNVTAATKAARIPRTRTAWKVLARSLLAVLTISGLSKAHGVRTLFRNVTFVLGDGRRVARVGANGVGKTTLLEIVMGIQLPDAGEVHRSADLRVGYLPQDKPVESKGTVLDETLDGG